MHVGALFQCVLVAVVYGCFIIAVLADLVYG